MNNMIQKEKNSMDDITKNIFVSHYHDDSEGIPDLIDLVKRNGLDMRDSSIYEAKEKNNAHNEDYIKSLIRPHISWAGTVVVLVGKKTKDSDWVNWEIETAAEKGKRIVGVYLNGCRECPIPEALKKHGDALVGWSSDSIIDAINGEDIWIGPPRTWNTGHSTC